MTSAKMTTRITTMPNDKRWQIFTARGQLKMAAACARNSSRNLTGLRKKHADEYAAKISNYLYEIDIILREELNHMRGSR